MQAKIRVLVADKHLLMRTSIRANLSIKEDLVLAGEASDSREAQQLSKELEPNVLLLALNTLDSASIETLTDLHRSYPEVKIIILTIFNNICVRDLIVAGAAGYVLESEEAETLTHAIRTVAKGGTWFNRPILEKLVQSEADDLTQAVEVTLTNREQQIVSMIAQGSNNSQIAAGLNLAEQTVRNYTSRIYEKIAVSSRAQAVIWAMQNGFGKST